MSWFGNRDYKMPEVKQPQYIEPPKDEGVAANINQVYSIGNNLNGDTIVHLNGGNTTMILTLTPPEVNRMVRLLLASLEEDEIEDDIKD